MIKNLTEVLTLKEAAEMWHLSSSDILKQRLQRGALGLIQDIDYRKCPSVWLITKGAMVKIYGEPKNE